mgnify:CR=1 FL=1
MHMASGKQSPSGPLAVAVAAEVRAAMGRQRVSGIQLATLTGISQNYVAKRLRDEAPFTLNDVERICEVLGEDFTELITNAAAHIRNGK